METARDPGRPKGWTEHDPTETEAMLRADMGLALDWSSHARLTSLEPVSLPYFEWDRIPHWSSMERQRYLQRKLEIREKLEYEGGDSSAFAPLPDGDDDGDSDLARLS